MDGERVVWAEPSTRAVHGDLEIVRRKDGLVFRVGCTEAFIPTKHIGAFDRMLHEAEFEFFQSGRTFAESAAAQEEGAPHESDYTVEQMCTALRALAPGYIFQAFEWGGKRVGTVCAVLEAATDHLERSC